MPNMSQLTIDNVTYDLKDTEGRAHLVEVSNTKPAHEDNKIWIKDQENEYVVPSYDEFEDLKAALNATNNDLFNFEDTGNLLLTRGAFGRDLYNPNTEAIGTTRPYRISSRKQISFPFDVTLTAVTGFKMVFWTWDSDNNNWKQASTQYSTRSFSANTPFYVQIRRDTEDSSEIADIVEFINAISVSGGYLQSAFQTIDEKIALLEETRVQVLHWYQGGYGHSGTAITTNTNADRIRTQFIPFPQNVRVKFKNPNARIGIIIQNPDGTYNSLKTKGPFSNASENTIIINNTSSESVTGDYRQYKLGIMVLDNTGVNVTPSDLDDYVEVAIFNDLYVNSGKQVLIYQFGGAGNDWCFVRTPENYNQFREKPYPFVICNHGNGWTMDGTIQKANWTKRTMYIPSTDPDAGSEQYNVTDDETLWYSNPTIEALLNAGYIVCGCENYGDGLYGNNDCRNACVDFFHHMVKRYNVEDRCYMIGASNGAMTSLNAAYLLQGAVKAMILQYPLTCLVNQYEHPGSSASGHPAAIRAAYGILDASITEEELIKAVATHDPLTVDVVNGQKVGTFPPTKLYYSEGDQVVSYDQNAIPLYNMLYGSNKVVEKVQCTGNHGDKSMFAPADFVAWFDAN